MRQEILGERAAIQQERRAANVMAIMMDYNQHQLQWMVTRIDRLRSLIANHQMPCPLGDTIWFRRIWMELNGTRTPNVPSFR